mmetsp:Transcript_32111/g.92287  ORF Transcript_32111/g.92287 Transcript_32111/m.92287 type:complete len:219 (-) Transcript_32111:365-1021(-)
MSAMRSFAFLLSAALFATSLVGSRSRQPIQSYGCILMQILTQLPERVAQGFDVFLCFARDVEDLLPNARCVNDGAWVQRKPLRADFHRAKILAPLPQCGAKSLDALLGLLANLRCFRLDLCSLSPNFAVSLLHQLGGLGAGNFQDSGRFAPEQLHGVGCLALDLLGVEGPRQLDCPVNLRGSSRSPVHPARDASEAEFLQESIAKAEAIVVDQAVAVA